LAGNLSPNRVLSGRLAGFTKAEVEALWLAYKADPFASVITAASINGQSLSFGQGVGTAERQRILQNALAQVDPAWSPPSQTLRVRFGAG
jgi:hypothetical protein